MKHLNFSLATAAVAIVSAGVSVFCYNKLSQPRQTIVVEQKNPIQFTANRNGGIADFTYAAEVSVNAVVHIMAKFEPRQSGMRMEQDPFFEYFFGQRPQPQKRPAQVGSGSGVILSQDGYIVTNNHVVEGADNITVVLNDKRSFEAQLIGTDPTTDLALLKVDASELPTLPIGNSDDLKIGEWVLAVGNPFNLTSTVTAGIVSAKARSINILNSDMRIESFIQTDAAVNPGNSGGALVNTNGELVGINTAIASQTGSYSGYSFAVPVSIMGKVVADLKQYGVVQRALLGININDINAEFAKEKDIDVLEGVYVASVNPNSAAHEAGIQEGDVIIKANGQKVKSVSELQEQIGRHRPGDMVEVCVLRNRKEIVFEVTLKNKLGSTSMIKGGSSEVLGGKFTALTDRQKRMYGVDEGLCIEKVTKGGKLSKAGVPNGYILVKANNRMVKDLETLEAIISEAKQTNGQLNEHLFLAGYTPNGKIVYYAIDLNE